MGSTYAQIYNQNTGLKHQLKIPNHDFGMGVYVVGDYIACTDGTYDLYDGYEAVVINGRLDSLTKTQKNTRPMKKFCNIGIETASGTLMLRAEILLTTEGIIFVTHANESVRKAFQENIHVAD